VRKIRFEKILEVLSAALALRCLRFTASLRNRDSCVRRQDILPGRHTRSQEMRGPPWFARPSLKDYQRQLQKVSFNVARAHARTPAVGRRRDLLYTTRIDVWKEHPSDTLRATDE